MKLDKKHRDLIVELNEFVLGLDERVRESAFNFLLAQAQDPPSTDRLAAKVATPEKKERDLSPQELIRQTNASSATAKAEVLAYWLEVYQTKENISSNDLKEAFNLAREPAPKNASD